MRVLCATTAGAGHFGPIVPLARACASAGHEVLVAAPHSFADHVRRAGLDHAGFADVPGEVMGRVFARLPELTRPEANALVLGEVFGRLDAQAALPAMTEIVRDWRPEVVLREPAELSSLVAAEACGVPHAQVAIGMTHGEHYMASLFVEPLGELAAMAGVDPAQATTALTSTSRLTSVPAVLDDALSEASRLQGLPGTGPVARYRLDLPASGGDLPPPWGDPAKPLVYVSFGSVAGTLGPFGATYPAALHELADLPVRVLMTTGEGLSPDDLDPLPPNTHAEAWWPQQDVLPHAAAVVGHGGFGTTMATLAAGVPQVVVPLFAHDQFVNADHVSAVGAGLRLEGGPGPVPGLGEAVADLLATPGYLDRARVVAADIAAMPPAAECVGILEDLAAG